MVIAFVDRNYIILGTENLINELIGLRDTFEIYLDY